MSANSNSASRTTEEESAEEDYDRFSILNQHSISMPPIIIEKKQSFKRNPLPIPYPHKIIEEEKDQEAFVQSELEHERTGHLLKSTKKSKSLLQMKFRVYTTTSEEEYSSDEECKFFCMMIQMAIWQLFRLQAYLPYRCRMTYLLHQKKKNRFHIQGHI
jgi:hypothetical protein